ncbi:ATP phosphoribosyltransferase 2, chloroplastic [Vitis vinifera]|uniref:ATP phosphoribosyltransferase n=1 Tax=Vitis vinifera TaxID=29760 RepID=A0A438G480_VITVI|nr:ATP phosphoribosyltransferase 2, chloroplastic [Vitis vinifera]
MEVWFQRPKDIVRKLLSGDLDLGIVGLDTVTEYGQGNDDLIIAHDALEYGDCRLSLAIPKYGIFENINSLKELAQMPQWTVQKPLRVATGFTYLGPKFLKENGLKHVTFSTADGALEAAPAEKQEVVIEKISMGESERERERENGDDEGDESATKRRKRERKSFVVESKTFEIDAEEKRGKIQVAIWEKKKGISSWVRLGPESLGFFLESLDHCIKDGKGGKWEREWKESGRSYSLVRNENKAGLFLRLGWSIWRRNGIVLLSREVRGKRGMGDHGGEATANGRSHGKKGA